MEPHQNPRPTVGKFMTRVAHTIGYDQTLQTAEGIMRKYQIRHLPVLKAGRLIGLLSERDLKIYRGFEELELDELFASDTANEPAYQVPPCTPLIEVVREMANSKFGSAVIVENGIVQGIFTAIDAMGALIKILPTDVEHP